MAQSIDKSPFFDGNQYAHWKTKMKFFMKSRDYKLWDIVEDGPFVLQRSKAEWSAEDRKKMELNCKALHILFCAFGTTIYEKMSSCESAKEVWDKLEVTYEGTNEVKETKIGLLTLEYENFKMDPEENIEKMFDRFSTITNGLKGYGEAIPEEKLVRKLIYSLPESRDSKRTAIIEAKNLKTLKLDELMGSLLTHQIMKKNKEDEKKKEEIRAMGKKKIMELCINASSVALKSSTCHHVDSSEEESEDEEMAYLFTKFTRFMKSEMDKSKHESRKKMKDSHKSKKRGSSSKQAYVATWSDEDSIDDEVAHLCLMALNEGEITSNSSISNSYTFDELQDAYDDLLLEFKASFSKNKKLISKIKIENDLLSKTNLEIEAKLKDFEQKCFDLQNLLLKVQKEKDLISNELEKKNSFRKSNFYVRQSSAPRFVNGKCFRSVWVPKGLTTSTKKDEIEK
ncbi:hypothetical protein HRI_000286800 [Hibiscus trionum]|uniref:DUF4219 domain-containing protein n=1 Tax=Hibiscus trionum TaxID=183268 RepID=A0A9W7GYF6_HIBTR|nr:hypothetical protein HRI_000286800 [Hibiscus trionum]